MKKCTLLLLAILFITCSKSDEPGPRIAPVAENYLNEVISIMEQNSINRLTIDWADFRKTVFNAAGTAQSIRATDPAITFALRRLGDNHSFVITTDGRSLFAGSLNCQGGATPANPASDVGYVRITFFTGSQIEMDRFAQNLQATIRNQDTPTLKGWVVDLRGNGGGNMWPMLAGVGPILGEGIAGHFIDPENRIQSWSYRNGRALGEQTAIVTIPEPYSLIKPNPKVAVLIDNGTASSGEALAISFKGRPSTRFFGASTCGLSTANSGFTLSDGAQLWLTVSVMADRNQNRFGKAVDPDERLMGEEALNAAYNWIRN